ncbi:MAG: electron transfer flavoprotein subunit beta/FixA family protein, partial [Anaerolineae bacterium]
DDLDPFGVAQVLAASLARIEHDLIWLGWKGVDHDHGIVGAALAELLDLPHVSFVVGVEIAEDGKSGRMEKEVEGAHEVVETSLPAVLTAQKGLNEPRYPSLKGIMAVKNKPITVWGAEELGLDVQRLAPRLEFVSASLPPQRKGGMLIEGSSQEQARELVRLLREEAKVI